MHPALKWRTFATEDPHGGSERHDPKYGNADDADETRPARQHHEDIPERTLVDPVTPAFVVPRDDQRKRRSQADDDRGGQTSPKPEALPGRQGEQ